MSCPASIVIVRRWSIVCVLLILYGVVAWTSARKKSVAHDELAHLTAGYSYWVTNDFRLHPENGVFPQRWAALPLLVSNVQFPDQNNSDWWTSNVWDVGRRFFFEMGNDADAMLWRGRTMIVLLGMLLGFVVYNWSRRLFGPTGGLISLALYAFSPTMLAHGALITSDMAVSLTFLASLACCWMTLHHVSLGRVVGSGLLMGLLLVSKMSAVLIAPIGIILLGVRLWIGRPLIVHWRKRRVIRGRAAQSLTLLGVVAAHAILSVLVIWAFYSFRFETFRNAEAGRDQMSGEETIESLAQDDSVGVAVKVAANFHLLPKPYLYGFIFAYHHAHARNGFLHGEYSINGWRQFFPYAFAIKTPLATFGMVFLALFATAAKWTASTDGSRAQPAQFWNRAKRGVYRTAPLWSFLLVYWFVAINSQLNIGHRHILPTYAPMFILCGAAGYWVQARRKVMAVLVVVALGQLAVESAFAYPHYLAYFNQLIGGPRNGYRHLVDSSLDWGQDLPGLKRWLSEQQDPARKDQPVYLSYFGTGDPEYFGLGVLRLPGWPDWRRQQIHPLEPGTYCISATMLQCVYLKYLGDWNLYYEQKYADALKEISALEKFLQQNPGASASAELAKHSETLFNFDHLRLARLCAFLRMREPDDSVGYSILIYYLDEDDLDMALNKPPIEWNAFYGRAAEPNAAL